MSFNFISLWWHVLLIGLVTNHLQEGLILGGSLQMMALGWANVGASVAPDVTLASVASSIFMVQGLNGSVAGEYVISASIAIAIPLSVIGLSLTKICRTKAIGLVHKWMLPAKRLILARLKDFKWQAFVCRDYVLLSRQQFCW